MDIPFFYEKEWQAAGQFTLSEDTSRHCTQVLRMKHGDAIRLTNGRGRLGTATIIKTDKRASEVLVQDPVQHNPPARNITVGISLLKNASRLEWFLEKATEIGVSGIVPLICHRTEKQHTRHDRLGNILIAAMLQSQQTWLPVLSPVTSFSEALALPHAGRFIAHCEEQQRSSILQLSTSGDSLVLIGPEGDFTTDEIAQAIGAGFLAVSLGETRLRSETAGMVAVALLNAAGK